MTLLPFTPEGLQEKLQNLYKMPDEELLKQAQAIRNDCRTWTESNFELSHQQREYLKQVPDFVNFTWGSEFSAVVASRGKITMDPLPENLLSDRPKQIKVAISGETIYNPGGSSAREPAGGPEARISWITE